METSLQENPSPLRPFSIRSDPQRGLTGLTVGGIEARFLKEAGVERQKAQTRLAAFFALKVLSSPEQDQIEFFSQPGALDVFAENGQHVTALAFLEGLSITNKPLAGHILNINTLDGLISQAGSRLMDLVEYLDQASQRNIISGNVYRYNSLVINETTRTRTKRLQHALQPDGQKFIP